MVNYNVDLEEERSQSGMRDSIKYNQIITIFKYEHFCR